MGLLIGSQGLVSRSIYMELLKQCSQTPWTPAEIYPKKDYGTARSTKMSFHMANRHGPAAEAMGHLSPKD